MKLSVKETADALPPVPGLSIALSAMKLVFVDGGGDAAHAADDCAAK